MRVNSTKINQSASEVRSGCPGFQGYELVTITDFYDGSVTTDRVKIGESVNPEIHSPI